MRPNASLRSVCHAADAALVAHVELEANGAAAFSLDFVLEGPQTLDGSTGDHEIRARARQCTRERLAKATAGASYDRDSSGEIEQ